MTVRRLKTYTGSQGYVYQYYFVGQRPAAVKPSEGPATEYIFDITSEPQDYICCQRPPSAASRERLG